MSHYAHALNQLARHNVNLLSLTDEALDNLVYGKGIPTATLISMHEAASLLKHEPDFGNASALETETAAALGLRALNGDSAARTYLNEVSA